MREIQELLSEIDEKTLESISKPRRKLIKFLKEIYSKEGGSVHA